MNTYLFEFLNFNGAETSIKFSSTTKKFYVSTTAELLENNILTSFCEHEDSIEKAIDSFNKRIEGKLIVINAFGRNKREILIPNFNMI